MARERPGGAPQGRLVNGTAPAPAGGDRVLSYLAFDFGLKRVGVATGNTLLRRGSPLGTIGESGDGRFARIGQLIDQWRPDALVVGVPRHPDGQPHENTARALRFARQLRGRYRLEVHEVDERYSTVEAQSGGAADVDAQSAAIILDQYLGGLP